MADLLIAKTQQARPTTNKAKEMNQVPKNTLVPPRCSVSFLSANLFRPEHSLKIRIEAQTEDGQSLNQEYPQEVLMLYSGLVKQVLEKPYQDQFQYVAGYGLDQVRQECFIILKDVDADYCFPLFDRLVHIHSTKQPFGTDNLPFYAVSKYLEVANILRVNLVKTSMEHKLKKMAEDLLPRDQVQAVWSSFKAEALPRRLAVQSVAEHCLALVEYGNQDKDTVWRDVFVPGYSGMPEFAREVSEYYRHHLAIREKKRAGVENLMLARRAVERQQSIERQQSTGAASANTSTRANTSTSTSTNTNTGWTDRGDTITIRDDPVLGNDDMTAAILRAATACYAAATAFEAGAEGDKTWKIV